jgi:hypothetical protein
MKDRLFKQTKIEEEIIDLILFMEEFLKYGSNSNSIAAEIMLRKIKSLKMRLKVNK